MLAPHVNPRATEYGVVLRGEGVIQVVFPNGSLAMSATVRAGDVFWVPRYFPFCQAASRGAPLEFFGFTTSARPRCSAPCSAQSSPPGSAPARRT
jgi:oxalate decarboxylase/phosphoglucose isomerase-like protein (cupin superfamily)